MISNRLLTRGGGIYGELNGIYPKQRQMIYFYSSKGTSKTRPAMIYLTIYTFYMCMTNQNEGFNLSVEGRIHERHENLHPQGKCTSPLPMRSNRFLFPLSLVNENLKFNFELVIRSKIIVLYFIEHMDGGWWVDGHCR